MNSFLQLSPLTAPVRAHIRNWATHWTDRHWQLPPEALDLTDPRWSQNWSDLFAEDANGFLNPVRAPWFESLPQTATRGDVATLDAACGPHPVGRALARFLLHQLLQAAWLRDQAGLDVSPTLPQELRAQGVSVPETDSWICENNRVRQEREIAATTQLLEDLWVDAAAPTATPPASTDTTPVPSMPSPRTVNVVAVRGPPCSARGQNLPTMLGGPTGQAAESTDTGFRSEPHE